MSAELIVTGIKKEFEGKRDQALADLRVYLTAPVGVGEHSSLSVEVKNIVERIADADAVIDTLDKYIQEAPPQSEENVPVVE